MEATEKFPRDAGIFGWEIQATRPDPACPPPMRATGLMFRENRAAFLPNVANKGRDEAIFDRRRR
jgi:hypothetical protein